MGRFSAALLLGLLVTSIAYADGSETTQQCIGLQSHFGDDPDSWIRVGRIVGDTPAVFRPSLGFECSSMPGQCRSYVIEGDLVAIVGEASGYACVQYSKTGKERRNFLGWIPVDRIKVDESAASRNQLSPWVGTWQNQGAKINIEEHNGLLHAVGHAVWQGRSDSHFGEFDLVGAPDATGLTLMGKEGPRSCTIRLALIGTLLAASDNMLCGGFNVTFTGFYPRHYAKPISGKSSSAESRGRSMRVSRSDPAGRNTTSLDGL